MGICLLRKASVDTLTTDELWALIQIGVVTAAFFTIILVFVYLAYERPAPQ